jgi:hypothetical protein
MSKDEAGSGAPDPNRSGDVTKVTSDRIMSAPGVITFDAGFKGVIEVIVDTLTPDNNTPAKLGLPERLDGRLVVVRQREPAP